MRNLSHVPPFLAEGPYFYSEKYISGNSLDSIYADFTPIARSDIETIVKNIVDVARIKSSTLRHRQPWDNNQEFFLFQINNTISALHRQSRRIPTWRKAFGIDWATVAVLDELPRQASQNRPLCLIHGDRHKNNMIRSNGTLYFIDWEYGCIGDLAYELAFHIHQMKYNDTDLAYFLACLRQLLPSKLLSALNDIDVYMKYIALRSVMYYMRILQECAYTARTCEKFYLRLHELAKYSEFDTKDYSLEEVKTMVKALKMT